MMMDHKWGIISCTVAAVASVCLVTGLLVLSGGEGLATWSFETIVTIVDSVLKSKTKRHIVGGLLLSASLFFGGLAVTVISLRAEEDIVDEE